MGITFSFFIFQIPILNCHKWFVQDKKMSNSEESSGQFTLEYYANNSNKSEPKSKFIECLNFATEAHKDQKRKDVQRTPYINHPIGVAYIISEEAGITNLDIICGSLLHDTVEDTAVVIELIKGKFGDYIGNLVQEVTDDKTLDKQKRKDLQVMNAKLCSPQAKIVKLADKLYNLRDLEKGLPEGWSEERRKEYYEWAFRVCEGLCGISPELEKKLSEFFNNIGMIFPYEGYNNYLKTPWPNHNELKPLLAAINFAAEKHRLHFVFDDKTNVPYINHVVSVTFIINQEAEIEDDTVLCASLLLNVVNKSNTTIEEIVRIFGTEVGHLVAELTYDQSFSIEKQFNSQMKRVTSISHSAKLITLAVILDQCRRLQLTEPMGWSQELRENYFEWALQLCTILANTHSRLERELENIWVGQGLRPFPLKKKQSKV